MSTVVKIVGASAQYEVKSEEFARFSKLTGEIQAPALTEQQWTHIREYMTHHATTESEPPVGPMQADWNIATCFTRDQWDGAFIQRVIDTEGSPTLEKFSAVVAALGMTTFVRKLGLAIAIALVTQAGGLDPSKIVAAVNKMQITNK